MKCLDFFKIQFLIGGYLLLFTGESLALQGSGHNNWHMMERWGMGGFGGFFMIIFWIIIIIGAIYLIKFLMQKGQNKDGPSDRVSSSKPQPIEILKERYAKGEIDKKEFEEKKKDLM